MSLRSNRLRITILAVVLASGCASSDTARLVDECGQPLEVISSAHPRTRKGFGPPPYGYWRILGDTVTDEMRALEWSSDTPAPMVWNFLGPRPVSTEYWSGNNDAGGRVVSIACHPTDAAIAYAASASGGIWKTTNSGANWSPVTDNGANLNHGVVTLDRSWPNTVYAGTGEYTTGSSGGGLLRSLDGGNNWSQIATSGVLGSDCSGLVIVPGAGANSPAAIHWSGKGGYWRSLNGGSTWTSPITANCSSLVVDAANPLRVFVAIRGVGIRRSLDGGETFPTLLNVQPSGSFSRIVLAQCRGTPDVLYAAFASGGNVAGFYRTADGGNNWTQLTATPNFAAPQAWYDLSVGVDPLNSNRVFCGGVSPVFQIAGVIVTTDGGQTWTEISGTGGQIHPDQHIVSFGADNIPWFGCDGGIWRRVGNKWVNCNATLGAIQNYTIHEHPNDMNRLMAGTQDNGMAGTDTLSTDWPQLVPGDGGYGAYFNDVYSTLFTTYVYLRVFRVTASGSEDITGPWTSDTREWISPLVSDLNFPTTLLGGSNRLWRNAAALTSAEWTAISDTTIADGATLTDIAPVPGRPGVIWVGNREGGVWRTLDGGATWTRVRMNDGTRIATISPRPGVDNTAVIVRNTSSGQRVLRTTDGGANWVNLTGPLPSGVTAKALAVDWDRGLPSIFVGSGAGVYSSFNGGASWVKSGPDLPNVNIGQLEINRARRTIATGTYGRGAWRSVLPQRADLDLNGAVDGADLSILVSSWGACSDLLNCPADVDGSGVVDATDLALLLGAWGN